MMKKYIFFCWLLAGLLTAPAFAVDKRFNVPIGNSPSLGPGDAPVTVIEFLDFQ